MSLGEILVIGLVALLVLSPKDIKKLIKYFTAVRNYFLQIETTFHSILNSHIARIKDSDEALTSNIQDINYYMKKITDLGSVYQGDYNLSDIKNYYELLSKNSCNKIP